MSRILILANDNSTIYNFRRELLYRLIAENHEIVISLPRHERNVEFEKMGCKVDEIQLNRSSINPLKELTLLNVYKNQMKRIRPDIVLTYTAKPNIYGSIACQKLNIPYINNVTGLGSNFQSDNLIKRIMLLLQKKAYKKSECVFFQNASNKEYFEEKKVVRSNTSLLPGSGVNLELHKYGKYPQNDGKVRFIVVSRIRKDKGFNELFDAVKLLSKNYENIEFHIVGWYEDDYYRRIINEMTSKYPVVYHGSQLQEKVHTLIENSHCLIHPSHHEGMANVLLEGAATGRPCLASNIPGCKETIDDGVTGFLFDVQNSESLYRAITKFMVLGYEEKVKMGLLGRKKMEMEFDRRFVIDAYINEIDKILERQVEEVQNVSI